MVAEQQLKLKMAEYFEVEKIVASKESKGRTLYRVRWKTYGPKDDTWEPENHLKGCQELLEDFRAQEKGQKSSSKTKANVKNTKAVVEQSAKFLNVNWTGGLTAESHNTRMTVSEKGDWLDDSLLRRSTLGGRHRRDATPKMLANSQIKPENTSKETERNLSGKATTTSFVVFICVTFVMLVTIIVYLASK